MKLTSGLDYKMTLTLCDMSITGDDANFSEGIVLNIFRPEAEMPQVNVSDVVLLHSAKVGSDGCGCDISRISDMSDRCKSFDRTRFH